MPQIIIFSLIGLAVGFSAGSGVIGAAVGFLVAKIIEMSNKIARMERDIAALQAQQRQAAAIKKMEATPSVEVSKAAPTSESSPANPVAASNASTQPAITSATSEVKEDPWTRDVVQPNAAATPKVEPTYPQQQAKPVLTKYRPQVPPTPSAPNPVEKAFDYVRRFFTEGNPIVRIGMLVLFVGLSFLVKYASSQGMFPIEFRLAIVCIVASALIVIGWKTRARAGGYGLVLQGGGIGALYLTIFAAAKMYALMPSSVAFTLMFIVVILGAALAILQNAEVLALMATAGGFLAPILTSDGSGNHIGLFSFYLLLNIGILIIAWFKTWRLLNWVGFVFTFVITSVWGVLKYEPQFYASTQPFLIAFFALYLTVAVLFSLKQPPNLKGLVDGSLVFGLPIVGFGLQTALLKHTEYGLAISAIILAGIYILLARLLWAKYQHTHRVLIESFIALGVTFATLTIPLALDAQWTSASWALEATGLIWVGLRQKRLLPRVAGYLLHFGAAVSLLIHGIHSGDLLIVSGDFISLLILAASALCIAYLLYRFTENCLAAERGFAGLIMIIGWLWWLGAGFMELEGHIDGKQLFPALIVFFTLSASVFVFLAKKIAWPSLNQFGFWLLPLTALWVLRNYGEILIFPYDLYPTQGWGWLAFSIFFAANYYFLWQQSQKDLQPPKGLLSAYHVISAWFLCALVYWEASWWQSHFNWYGTSAAVLWFACLMIPLSALIAVTPKNSWPFNLYRDDYKHIIPAPLLALLLMWFIKASTYSGLTAEFYVPILNPVDLAQLSVVVLMVYAMKRDFVRLSLLAKDVRFGLLGGLGFIWINIVLLRAIHQYVDVSYYPSALWNSVVVQTALSILWAVCALIVMNISRRLQERKLWMLGAGLLGVIVVKLALKDLSGAGTLAGIISFMVVGALMLLIGYLSPIPAKTPISTEVKN